MSRNPVSRLKRAFARLEPLVGKRRRTLAAIGFGSAGAGIAEAAVLALIAHIALAMSLGGSIAAVDFGPLSLRASVPLLLAAAGVIAVVRLVLQVLVVRLPAKLSGEVQSRLRTRLFDAYLRATWSEKAKEREGHLQELMGGQTLQAGNAPVHLANVFSGVLMLSMLAGSAFVLSPLVAGLVLAVSAMLFGALRPLTKRVRTYSRRASAALLDQASGVAESVRMAEEVQTFGVDVAHGRTVGVLIEQLRSHQVRTRALSMTVPVLYQSAIVFLLVAGLALVYGLGAARLATLGATVLLLIRGASYGQRVLTSYQALGETLPYLDQVTAGTGRLEAGSRKHGRTPLRRVEGLELRSAGFAYIPGRPVLQDVDLTIDAKETVGILGPSGAGKSTLLQMLLQLRQVTQGKYLVNGAPAREFREEDWHRRVAYLPQEPHLLQANVTENIRFHRSWVGDAAIERAARLAHIHEEIIDWPDGYKTMIGPRADSVSGGQKQRICLARALAGEPQVLLLDEPSSALDPASQEHLRRSLEALHGELLIVLVAHRSELLQECERLVAVEGGRVREVARPALPSGGTGNDLPVGAEDAGTGATWVGRSALQADRGEG